MNLENFLNEYPLPNIWWTISGLPGLVLAKGNDVLDLIHRLSTNNCLQLQHDSGKQTILTNEKGRIIDVITVIPFQDHILILTSRNQEEQVIQWLKKYIIMEDIKFSVVTEDYDMIALHGAESMDCVSQLLHNRQLNVPMHSIIYSEKPDTRFAIRCMPLNEMHFLIMDIKGSGLVNLFSDSSIVEYDEHMYQIQRILAGYGIYGNELSEEYNPLEAGLLHLIDFKKGCYIGQEVIARLDSYNKVQKRLMGFYSKDSVKSGAKLKMDDQEIGKVTSFVTVQSGTIGLAYVRSEHAYPESEIKVSYEDVQSDCTLHSIPMRK